jgi:hypothetical protein
MWSPEKVPNASRIILTASSTSFIGLMKMAASSAYMEVLHFAIVSGRGENAMLGCKVE